MKPLLVPMQGLMVAACLLVPIETARSMSLQHVVSTTLSRDADGKKWKTDAALRDGMSSVRAAMADLSDVIGSGELSPENYGMLASFIEGEVRHIEDGSKLPPGAARQQAIVLDDLRMAARKMRGADPRNGAIDAAVALNEYREIFDHEGFRPLSQ